MLELEATQREADCTLMTTLVPCNNPHLSGSKHLRIISELGPKNTFGKVIFLSGGRLEQLSGCTVEYVRFLM